MRSWHFTDEETIRLNGRWEFYPNEFLSPDYFNSTPTNKSWATVPAAWGDYLNNASDGTGIGFGTYRLRLLLPDNDTQQYGMEMMVVSSGYELFVNGRSVSKLGQPSANPQEHEGKMYPLIASIAGTNEMNIVLHVSNYDFPNGGGITKPIKFGTLAAVQREDYLLIAMQLMVAIIYILHLIYVGLLPLLGVRKKEIVYLAIVIFCMLLGTLVDDNKLLVAWLPISLHWNIKLLRLSLIGASTMLLAFSANFFPIYRKDRAIRVYLLLCALYAIVTLLLPYEQVISLSPLRIMAISLPPLIILIMILRLALKGEDNMVFLLFAAISVVSSIIWATLKLRADWDLPYYPFDLIFAFICFASFWFKQFLQTRINLEQLAFKLQKADKAKDEFLANTSHELRNPLHGMINMAQTVLANTTHSINEASKNNLMLLITVGRRMSLLLNDLLDVTRLKDRDIHLNKESVRLQNIISGVFDMLRYLTEDKPVQLEMNIPRSFPNIIADENRLIQILFNLIHNAVKFTNEGIVSVHAEAIGDKAYIHIQDSGVGIDADVQRTIFYAYEQGDSSMTAMSGGFGLGLSICRQLVELHGGKLTVQSVPGKGSTFTFTMLLDPHAAAEPEFMLPSEAEAAVSAESVIAAHSQLLRLDQREAASDTEQNKAFVLAVDDDPVNLKILFNLLDSEFYEVTTVTSGKKALKQLETKEWDLVIADVMMPQMSGYELTQTIRKRFSISELPILLLTARSRPEDVNAGFMAGANDYVTKPVDAMELKSRVQALTDLKQTVNERLRIEAAWLQAQIQPHFLFNTLNSIASLSVIDQSRMVQLLEEFGKYLRASFDMKNSERVVPLQHELDLLHSYLFIEKERFGNRLQIEWELDDLPRLRIPPLSIQPLVENAVRHGVLARSSGGTVRIRLKGYDDYTEIAIIDNGVGMEEEQVRSVLEQNHGGIGLRNTDRRLKQLYGKGLRIESTVKQGTVVSFSVPKSSTDEANLNEI
ncbi:ATP-binding protein [Paenibacillus algorifonticola]|uniref:hybrid sensor histidine kinase/response regulator n=1 Tax=Paenibacillus algorifonticola TaxID=684063 RepID=UPI001E2CEF9D|nr:ATP-binding protein [Paenibacillus algorifonticola]